MNRLLLCTMIFLAGCSIHAVDMKTVTIPVQDKPVIVTVKGHATCTDYFLFYKVTEQLDVKSTGMHQIANEENSTQGLINTAYGEVFCCCETYSGQCCKWVTFCSGFIPGCLCK